MTDERWELQERLADALRGDLGEAGVLGQELGLAEDEALDVAAALAALGAATAFDEPAPTRTAPLDAGERIGGYEVQERVGRGAFGVVYRARDPVLDVDVALKLIAVPPGVEEEVQERFTQEARAVARLDHPGIVRVRTAGWDPRGPFLVMDFVDGESLHRILEREGPLPAERAVGIARQLAVALEHAHQHGVIHRDVKPDNVLVTQDGAARLTDFGLARDALAQGESKVSREGHALGTPGFWPPEQARGDLDAIGPASDVYGLGATLYAMLTGRPPYTGPHTLAILEAMSRRAEVPPPSVGRAGVGPAFDALCARCLEHDPARRFPSARALASALAACEPEASGADHGRQVPGGVGVLALVGLALAAVVLAVVTAPREGQAEGWEASPRVAEPLSEAGVNPATPPAGEGLVPSLPSESEPESHPEPEPESDPAPWYERRPDWRQVHVAAAPPSRSDATLVSDPDGERVLLFGGAVRKATSAELWSWDGEEWLQLPTTGSGPSPRLGAAGVFDRRERQVRIFGGRSSDGWEEDGWRWDGRRWARFELPREARSYSKPFAAYDEARGVTVLLLGRELWERELGRWRRAPSPPVQGRQLLWSPAEGSILLFGQDGRLWDYDGEAWKGATPPLPRRGMRFLWAVPAGDDGVLALVGPKPPRKRSAVLETWLYRAGEWQPLEASSPAMPFMAGMAWVPGRGQALVFGGEKKRRSPGLTWTLSPTR